MPDNNYPPKGEGLKNSAAPFYSSESQNYKWYVLSLLFVIYTVNMIDRSILGILSESIKQELDINDSQLGLLGGMAFALFYSFMGFPLARIADRWIRRHLLLICLLSWSVMTMISGIAQNYWQLFLARVGVAIGEAGGTPASHSMISDLFPKEKRGTALSVFSVGIYVGAGIGMFLGGWINDLYGWRWAFIAAGTPGILIAIIGHFTLKEPKRGLADKVQEESDPADTPNVKEVITYLFIECKSFRILAIATSLNNLAYAGIFLWLPVFLIRSHGMSTTEIGSWLAFITLVANALGTFLGGFLADKLGNKFDVRWYLWIPAMSATIYIPFTAFSLLYPDATIALLVYFIPALLGALWLAPCFAIAQNIVGLRMRAMASTSILFLGVLIGQGLGPQIIGSLSDWLNKNTELGIHSLRWAMLFSLSFLLLAALFYLLATPFLKNDIERQKKLT